MAPLAKANHLSEGAFVELNNGSRARRGAQRTPVDTRTDETIRLCVVGGGNVCGVCSSVSILPYVCVCVCVVNV